MLKKKPRQKIIVILGPTASGKSSLAVSMSKKFNGEVISTDSRQVYRGLDIGTGKVTKKEMGGIKHHLLDVANPKQKFSASDYKKLAEKSIENILEREKVPIIAGGTGFYIDALLGETQIPEVPPNEKLRIELEKYSVDALFKKLQKLDHARSKTIEKTNKRRLIRAIEIAIKLGKVPRVQKTEKQYSPLKIGLTLKDNDLKEKINERLLARIKIGMIAEARNLHNKGLSWKRMEELGLEYRYLSRHLRGQLSKTEMLDKLNTEIRRYSKRQMRWFKRDKNIEWFAPTQRKEMEKEIRDFLSK